VGALSEPDTINLDPADVKYPRRALSRLAVCSSGAELAEQAAGHVNTTSDPWGDAYEFVEYAARTVATAQELLTRAVVHARELGGSWADIGDALSITTADAEDRYREAIARWEEALDAPWAEAHGVVYSRMPVADPDFTIDYLDRWCLTHLAPADAARSTARRHGVEEQMVSTGLPQHTLLTEMTSVARTATYLTTRGVCTGPEWEAYQVRKADVYARAKAQLRESYAD
jgi:hypothetical protein